MSSFRNTFVGSNVFNPWQGFANLEVRFSFQVWTCTLLNVQVLLKLPSLLGSLFNLQAWPSLLFNLQLWDGPLFENISILKDEVFGLSSLLNISKELQMDIYQRESNKSQSPCDIIVPVPVDLAGSPCPGCLKQRRHAT